MALAVAALFSAPVLAEEPVRVVATFSIIADFARNVGGDRIEVSSLVGTDADPHTFEPSSDQQAMLAQADLLIANGLGMEPWLDRVVESAGFKGLRLIASNGIAPLILPNGLPDPHAFQDPALAAIYVNNIAAGLGVVDPTQREVFERRSQEYRLALQKADADVRSSLKSVPAGQRQVLSAHQAFAYFGKAFDVEFAPIESQGGEENLSASELATLIDRARRGKFKAIFLENMTDSRLAETIAEETGIVIAGRLYADSLSPPNGPAPNYLALLRHNAAEIAKALE